jgi:hypothetical protein
LNPTPTYFALSGSVQGLPAFWSMMARGIRRAFSTAWRGYFAAFPEPAFDCFAFATFFFASLPFFVGLTVLAGFGPQRVLRSSDPSTFLFFKVTSHPVYLAPFANQPYGLLHPRAKSEYHYK